MQYKYKLTFFQVEKNRDISQRFEDYNEFRAAYNKALNSVYIKDIKCFKLIPKRGYIEVR